MLIKTFYLIFLLIIFLADFSVSQYWYYYLDDNCGRHHRHSYCKTGDDGDTGDRGYQGYTGPEGTKGERGYSGSNGRNGMKGALGDKGSQGLKGEKGESIHTNFTSEFWKLFHSDLEFQKYFKNLVTGYFLKSFDLQGHKGDPGVCIDLRMGNL